MEKDLKIFTINYFCPLRCPIYLCFIDVTFPGPWFGLVFSAVNGVGSDLFISLRAAPPFEEVSLNWGGLSPPLYLSECRVWGGVLWSLPLPPRALSGRPRCSKHLELEGKVGSYLGSRQGCFSSSLLLWKHQDANTLSGFWPLVSHRIFQRVHSLAHVVWKDLNFVMKAFGGFGGKMALMYTLLPEIKLRHSAIRRGSIGHHTL